MIGGGDRDRVDVLRLLMEHVAIVFEPLRLGVVLEGVERHGRVHVAQGVDVLTLHALDVVAAHATDADAGHVELVARRDKAAPQNVPRHDGKRRGGGGVLDEPAATDALLTHTLSPLRFLPTGLPQWLDAADGTIARTLRTPRARRAQGTAK